MYKKGEVRYIRKRRRKWICVGMFQPDTFHFVALVHACLWWLWITTQNIFTVKQYTDYENKNCGCPLLALLLFIDSVHLHLLPKPNFTIRQVAKSHCTKKRNSFCLPYFACAYSNSLQRWLLPIYEFFLY